MARPATENLEMDSPYHRVVAFVAGQRGVRTGCLTTETTLFGDLGTDGDDGMELLEDFGRAFSIDMSGCDPSRYFGPEGFFPWATICWLASAFRRGSVERRTGLQPISISDLVRSAELGRWDGG